MSDAHDMEWLTATLIRHGYIDSPPASVGHLDDESLNDLADYWEAHCESTIPARTTETGEPMRAHDWFKLQGRTEADYLAYLNREYLRDAHRMVTAVDPANLDEQTRREHARAIAEQEAFLAPMNVLEHPEEVEGRADRGGPSLN